MFPSPSPSHSLDEELVLRDELRCLLGTAQGAGPQTHRNVLARLRVCDLPNKQPNTHKHTQKHTHTHKYDEVDKWLLAQFTRKKKFGRKKVRLSVDAVVLLGRGTMRHGRRPEVGMSQIESKSRHLLGDIVCELVCVVESVLGEARVPPDAPNGVVLTLSVSSAQGSDGVHGWWMTSVTTTIQN